MKILIFTEGTILMHQSAAGLTRDEIIKQVQNHFPGINDFTSYIPIGNSVSKLNHWAKAGAEIIYLTSRRKPAEIEAIRNVLNRHGFPQAVCCSGRGNDLQRYRRSGATGCSGGR